MGSYKFLSSRTHKAHMLKRNPRKITWTVLYRRKHKKGLEEDVTKKRTRRAQKFQREQAVRAAKETKKAVTKKPVVKDNKAAKAQQKATKNVSKGVGRVGGKR